MERKPETRRRRKTIACTGRLRRRRGEEPLAAENLVETSDHQLQFVRSETA